MNNSDMPRNHATNTVTGLGGVLLTTLERSGAAYGRVVNETGKGVESILIAGRDPEVVKLIVECHQKIEAILTARRCERR